MAPSFQGLNFFLQHFDLLHHGLSIDHHFLFLEGQGDFLINGAIFDDPHQQNYGDAERLGVDLEVFLGEEELMHFLHVPEGLNFLR